MERGYPTVMAGKFNAYHHDPDSGVLTAEWDAEKGDSTILCLPHAVQKDVVEATGDIQIEICPIQGQKDVMS